MGEEVKGEMKGARAPSSVLFMENITKRFPGVLALDKVSFDLREGEIHALVGENGAGKSTLLKILEGTYLPDEGRILIFGKERKFRSLNDSRRIGVEIIPQEIQIAPNLTIAENIIMRYTIFGRYLYCIGGNPESARLSGISVMKFQTLVYTISGFLAAFGGIILASRLGAAQTSAGGDYGLQSVSAVLLGGTTLAGGEGGVLGTLIGVAIIGVLRNGLIMINMPSYYQFVATGIALLTAVLIDVLKKS